MNPLDENLQKVFATLDPPVDELLLARSEKQARALFLREHQKRWIPSLVAAAGILLYGGWALWTTQALYR